MADPTLGCIAGGQFVFVGNAGWSRFEGTDIKPTDPRPIPIFHTKLDPAVPVSAARAGEALALSSRAIRRFRAEAQKAQGNHGFAG